MAKKKVMMIDPDEGWRYGFPKAMPDGVGNTYGWLVENGYPKERIDYFENSKLGYLPTRVWYEEVDE